MEFTHPASLAEWLNVYGDITVFIERRPFPIIKGKLQYWGTSETPTINDFMIMYKGTPVSPMAFIEIYVDKYPDAASLMKEFKQMKEVPYAWIQVYSPGFPTLGDLFYPEPEPEPVKHGYTFRITPPGSDVELFDIADVYLQKEGPPMRVYWRFQTQEVYIVMPDGTWYQQSDAPICDSLAALPIVETENIRWNNWYIDPQDIRTVCHWVQEPSFYSGRRWLPMTSPCDQLFLTYTWSSFVDCNIMVSFGIGPRSSCCCKDIGACPCPSTKK
jgi:hypothetical protein